MNTYIKDAVDKIFDCNPIGGEQENLNKESATEIITDLLDKQKRDFANKIIPRAKLFIRKVDSGAMRSKETYKDMKYIISLFE